MGALEIRVRSATPGNIGAIREVDTRTGALEAANRVAASVRELGRARISAAEAEGRGWAALGRGVASLSGFADIAADCAREEQRRNADEYAAKFQARMREHDQGDGKDVRGAMNETIPDTDRGEWMDRNRSAAKKIHADVLKEMGLTEADFKGTRMEKWRDQHLFKETAQWLAKDSAAKAGYARRNANAVYDGALSDVTGPMVSEDGWEKLDSAVERKIEVDGMGEEEAAMFRRKTGLTVWGIGIRQALDAAMERALAAGADGGKEFERLEKDWKGLAPESLMPPASTYAVKDAEGNVVRDRSGSPVTRNPLEEWTRGADFKSVKAGAMKDLADYKARWRTARDAAEAKRKKAAVDGAHRRLVELYTGRMPDGSPMLPPLDENDPKSIVAHYGRLAQVEKEVGESLRDTAPAEAESYAKSAERLARRGASKAREVQLARNDEEFLKAYADPTHLGDPLKGRKMTPGEAIRAATYAHGKRRISDAAYTKALKACSEAVDSDNEGFISDACDAIGYACPGILASKGGEIVINRSGLKPKDRQNPEAADTGIDRTIEDSPFWEWKIWRRSKKEDVTLGNLRRAIQLFTRQILEDEKNGTWSAQKRVEYLKRFKELIKPDVEDYNRRSLQDALDAIDGAFGAPRPQGGSAIDDIRVPR